MSPLEVATLAHAALGAAFVAVATTAFLARPQGARANAVRAPVLLLRAAEAVDDALAARLARDADAYEGPLVRILCLPSREAGAPVTADAFPGLRVAVSDLATDTVCNRKARHLAAGVAEASRLGLVAPDTVVVHADADVVLLPRDLDRLVATLVAYAPRGAAFAAPSPSGGSPVAQLAVRAIVCASPQAFAALWSLARLTGAPPAMAGKLVALRAETLAAIGGYERVSPFIADDVALVDALHACGCPIALAPFAAETCAPTRTLADVRAQMARWLAVASAHRPGLLFAYPLLVAPAIVTLLLAVACVVAGHGTSGAVAVALLVTTRTALAWALAGLYAQRGEPRNVVLQTARILLGIVLGDALLTAAMLASIGHRRIAWGGRIYELEPRGRGRIQAIRTRI